MFCQGKTVGQVVQIVGQILKHEGRVLATRASPRSPGRCWTNSRPGATTNWRASLRVNDAEPGDPDRPGRTEPWSPARQPYVVVATGGTSDIPVAEEAAFTLEFLGDHVLRAYDVGVAGIHRLLSRQELLRGAAVVIAVAGMEGALASVVAGLVDCPVVAVPTSIGYGASFGGLAALLSMLNSCAPGVSVVNIDNGFGAAVVAHQIVKVRDGEQRA